MQFGLQFEPNDTVATEPAVETPEAVADASEDDEPTKTPPEGGAEVVSLDRFRKK